MILAVMPELWLITLNITFASGLTINRDAGALGLPYRVLPWWRSQAQLQARF